MVDFDVLLLNSDAEGMPLVALEAQNLGIPVVSTDVGCVSEITEYTFKIDKLYTITKTILNLVKDNVNTNYKNAMGSVIKTFIKAYKSAIE